MDDFRCIAAIWNKAFAFVAVGLLCAGEITSPYLFQMRGSVLHSTRCHLRGFQTKHVTMLGLDRLIEGIERLP